MPTSKTRRTLRLLGVLPRNMEEIQSAEFERRWWQTPEETKREHDWPELLKLAKRDDEVEWIPMPKDDAWLDIGEEWKRYRDMVLYGVCSGPLHNKIMKGKK